MKKKYIELDEAVEKEFNNIWDSDLSGQCDTAVAKKVAYHFYRFGISHNLQLPSSFEEARDKANFEESHSLNAYIAFEEGFKAGAEWMARQGSSFECEVCETPQGQWAAGLHLCDCAEKEQSALKEIGAKDYDKVIVQIRRK